MEHDELADSLPAFADMHVEEIEEVLEELGLDISDDELHQIALFMKQSGSLDAALAALHELERKAA
jgi:ribosome assembly protein YihI (activator of Der GTPase)